MKDIRPILSKIEDLLESNKAPHNVAKEVERAIEDSSLRGTQLSFDIAPCGWGEEITKDCTCEVCLGHFEDDRKRSLILIKKLSTVDWPDSADSLVAAYQKPGAGLSLKIVTQVSGYKVECSEEELKQEVEKALTKLNQNQSAQNFLLNAVYVLPTKYKDYKLEL